MIRSFRRVLYACILFAPLLSAPAHAVQVGVRVLDGRDGRPLAGAAVCLGTAANPSQFGAWLTPADGTVVFREVPDTTLVLTLSCEGFHGRRRVLPRARYDRHYNITLYRGGLGPQCEGARPYGRPGPAAVTVRNFRLDGGAAVTRDREVTLDFEASAGVTHYRAAESPDLDDVPWRPLTDRPVFRLGPGPGRKTVYLQVRKYRKTRGAALELVSAVVSDTIELAAP